ncbi:MAG: DNA repair protein [Pseudooceanicola sp.]
MGIQNQSRANSIVALTMSRVVQPIMMGALVLIAVALTGIAVLAAFGFVAWPQIGLIWNGAPVENAGAWLVVGGAMFSLGLCAFLPANGRIMMLENSHRDFRISMHDIAHAYHKAHAADRKGAFRMSHEFDAVRERLAFLRDHPDLGQMEPAILEAAAQMSQISQELADTYSEDRVNRARTFLKQRQEEIEQFNDRLETAKVVTADLRNWLDAVEMEESIARSQLDRLLGDLDDILPELNIGVGAAVQQEQSSRTKALKALPTLAEVMTEYDDESDIAPIPAQARPARDGQANVIGIKKAAAE